MSTPEAADGATEYTHQANAAITALTSLACDFVNKRVFDVYDVLEPIASLANAMKGYECVVDELRDAARCAAAAPSEDTPAEPTPSSLDLASLWEEVFSAGKAVTAVADALVTPPTEQPDDEIILRELNVARYWLSEAAERLAEHSAK